MLEAVVKEIDMEMDNKLGKVSDEAEGKWEGFVGRCRAYLTMALNPEIQRIVLRDAPAVLGTSYYQSSQSQCLVTMAEMLQQLMKDCIIEKTDCEALARYINGGLVILLVGLQILKMQRHGCLKALHSLSLILNGLLLEKNA